jgi:cytochrome P450
LHRDPNYWREPLRFSPERWDELLQPQASSSGGGGGGGGTPAAAGSSSGGGSGGGGYSFAAALREMGPNGAYVPFGGGPR